MSENVNMINDTKIRERAACLLENFAMGIRKGDPNLLFVALTWRHQSQDGPGTLLVPGSECEGYADIVKATRELHHSAIQAQSKDGS